MKLIESVEEGDIEAVKQHLDAGADVNARNDPAWEEGSTPLHYAARWGHKEIAELLIAKGANVNAKNAIVGSTPLHHTKTKEIIKLLISEGADVNAKTDSGRTPLDTAIGASDIKTADLLRKHGGKTAEELKAEGK